MHSALYTGLLILFVAAAPSHLLHGLVLQVNEDAKFYVLHVQ